MLSLTRRAQEPGEEVVVVAVQQNHRHWAAMEPEVVPRSRLLTALGQMEGVVVVLYL